MLTWQPAAGRRRGLARPQRPHVCLLLGPPLRGRVLAVRLPPCTASELRAGRPEGTSVPRPRSGAAPLPPCLVGQSEFPVAVQGVATNMQDDSGATLQLTSSWLDGVSLAPCCDESEEAQTQTGKAAGRLPASLARAGLAWPGWGGAGGEVVRVSACFGSGINRIS